MAGTTILADFTGGVTQRLAATDFSERQWADLHGFVLHDDTGVRSQWPIQTVASGVTKFGVVDDLLVAFKDGSWQAAALPVDDAPSPLALTWTPLAGVPAAGLIGGHAPVRESGAWVNALVVTGLDGALDAAFVYLHPDTGVPTVKSVADRYPSAPTEVAVPQSTLATMWGSFLVHGNISWLANENQAYSASNTQRFPHGLWYSSPTDVASYDPIDVEFVGQKAGDNEVVGMFPIDTGLVVLTRSAVFLLRGTPSDHDYEELRAGVSPARPEAACAWPETGAVAWVDDAGRVWHTNGESFLRMDDPLTREWDPLDAVGAIADHLVVSRGQELWAFRVFRQDGAWTRLSWPGSKVAKMVPWGDCLYLLDEAGALSRFATTLEAERGCLDGEETLPLTAATRTLEEGDGHRTTFWHRWGLRATGSGRLRSVSALAGPYLAGEEGAFSPGGVAGKRVEERQAWVWPGHGASPEAAFVFRFEGDVELEQVSVWTIGGRAER